MKSLLAIIISVFFAFITFSDALRPSSPRRSHRTTKKSHRRGGHQLYGVSLSSITGFEKPIIPPKIINFDMPINYDQPPADYNELALDLPSKIDLFGTNSTNIMDFPNNSQLILQQ